MTDNKIIHFMTAEKTYNNSLLVENQMDLILTGILTGDMAGMPHEAFGIPEFENPDDIPLIMPEARPTDDTVMAAAVANAALIIKHDGIDDENEMTGIYSMEMRRAAKIYPDAGYGANFYKWAVCDEEDENYKSFGDGSAMRSGVIGTIFEKQEDVIRNAILSAMPTHSHPEGIKGAVVTAMLVWMGLHGYSKEEMLEYACKHYDDGYKNIYDKKEGDCLDPAISIEELCAMDQFTQSLDCRVAVPEAIANFVNSDSYEACIRNSFRYLCDTDTVAAISGGIAASYYGNTNIVVDEYSMQLIEEKKAEIVENILKAP